MATQPLEESTLVVNGLCPACRAALNSLPEMEDQLGKILHYEQLRDALLAAKHGCFICRSLAMAWENYDIDAESYDACVGCYRTVVSASRKENDLFNLYLSTKARSIANDFVGGDTDYPDGADGTDRLVEVFDGREVEVTLRIEPLATGMADARTVVVAAAGSTVDDRHMSIAKSWLDTCLVTHPGCKGISKAKVTHWYPSRLLRLDGSPTDPTIRLQDCRAELPSVPYVALSHRWGKAKFMTLGFENINALKLSIPFDALSKTFQHAISVTLKLGYNYLWIDSLCIIQDSNDDWLNEASSMNEVYQNSHFTISANTSRSLTNGLISVRCSDHVSCLYHDVRFKSRSQATKEARIVDLTLWSSLIRDTPLSRRGWILQERLLSPRVLHFTNSQLAWECGELEACQTYPKGILCEMNDEFTVPGGALRRALMPVSQHNKPLTKDEAMSVWHIPWWMIVEHYSRCQLTKASDKLVALSGIARHVQAELQDTYVAGLWKSNFVESLAWRTQAEIRNSRPKIYRAPSWSWAAVDGPICFPCRSSDSPKPVAELIDFDITLVDHNNPTGPVQAASVTLKGKLVGTRWYRNPWQGPWLSASRADGSGESEVLYSEHFEVSPDDLADAPQKTHCLVLLETFWLREMLDDDSSRHLEGIVLHQVGEDTQSPASPRTFRRVGFFHLGGISKSFLRLSQDTVVTLI